ncbi:hypothetical protein DRP53_04370 [candidate division WOR-3 bacterium]|uniref:Uncharacterized protein n=1 Tax=candidate division WOR-3 bacterium TaxID=2052148 RepID=A0A660SII1_UNCW3|nr:MAG: hypothetical protein DRP53_04370 [candidate division WOR-3 bacterium]
MQSLWRGSKYCHLRVWDVILIGGILLTNIFFVRTKSKFVTIDFPSGEIIRPINQDWQISVDGCLGKFTIVNKDGVVRVTETSCPNKTCMHSSITEKGGVIICIPNQVFIYLGGNLDGITW